MVKVMVKLFLSMQWRHMGGVEVQLDSFLTTAVGGGEWATSLPCCCTPVKETQYTLNRRLDGAHSWSGLTETRKVCCHCWDSNPRLSNSHPNHYTINPVPAPKRAHLYLLYCLVERSHGLANILTCKLIRTTLASQDRNVHCWNRFVSRFL